MNARLRAGLAAATLVAAALLACSDPNAPRANFPNYTDTLALYALNGAPLSAPTAVRLFGDVVSGTAEARTDGSYQFDVALDIDAEGRPVLLPVRAVAAPFVGAHRVGVRRVTQSFESILEAPTDNYQYDSVAVLTVGETVLLQSGDADAARGCFGGGVIYGKVIIDSVSASARRIFTRVTANPNCGFRSLQADSVPSR
jgi:hypothetical protein